MRKGSAPLKRGWYRDGSGRNSHISSVLLVIPEEEDLAFYDRAAHRSAKLVLVPWPSPVPIEIIRRIERGIAEELKDVAMNLIRPGLGYDVDLPTGEIPIRRVKVVRNNPKLRQRVQVWHHRRSRISVLLHRHAIQQIAIGRLPHAIHRQIAGILIARHLRQLKSATLKNVQDRGAASNVRARVAHPRLPGPQVRIAPAVQRDRSPLLILDDLVQLRRNRLGMQRVG